MLSQSLVSSRSISLSQQPAAATLQRSSSACLNPPSLPLALKRSSSGSVQHTSLVATDQLGTSQQVTQAATQVVSSHPATLSPTKPRKAQDSDFKANFGTAVRYEGHWQTPYSKRQMCWAFALCIILPYPQRCVLILLTCAQDFARGHTMYTSAEPQHGYICRQHCLHRQYQPQDGTPNKRDSGHRCLQQAAVVPQIPCSFAFQQITCGLQEVACSASSCCNAHHCQPFRFHKARNCGCKGLKLSNTDQYTVYCNVVYLVQC